MTLPGPETGERNNEICYRLTDWAKKNGTGRVFSPLTLFFLPNGAKRAPGAAWISREHWDSLTDKQRKGPLPLCPDFVLELMSPSGRRPVRFKMLQAKMDEYIENGVQLAWLIDPFKKNVYTYRPDKPVECLENPTTIYGDPVLPGFIFQITEVWQQ